MRCLQKQISKISSQNMHRPDDSSKKQRMDRAGKLAAVRDRNDEKDDIPENRKEKTGLYDALAS